MQKTLYISDLDGTLLRSDETLSPFTIQTINYLTGGGMLFSYSTARSLTTAQPATQGLNANLPVMVYNGTFIFESQTGRLMLANFFEQDEAEGILNTLLRGGTVPIVYAMVDGMERYSYLPEKCSAGVLDFAKKRPDFRRRAVKNQSELYKGRMFHFTCIDREEVLSPLYEALKGVCSCVYQLDFYTGEPWLEIMPKNASKASAAQWLKTYLGADKMVAFGDGLNDLSLFQASDECYAVENAENALKALATGVIPSHNQDGVARWLLAHAEHSKVG